MCDARCARAMRRRSNARAVAKTVGAATNPTGQPSRSAAAKRAARRPTAARRSTARVFGGRTTGRGDASRRRRRLVRGRRDHGQCGQQQQCRRRRPRSGTGGVRQPVEPGHTREIEPGSDHEAGLPDAGRQQTRGPPDAGHLRRAQHPQGAAPRATGRWLVPTPAPPPPHARRAARQPHLPRCVSRERPGCCRCAGIPTTPPQVRPAKYRERRRRAAPVRRRLRTPSASAASSMRRRVPRGGVGSGGDAQRLVGESPPSSSAASARSAARSATRVAWACLRWRAAAARRRSTKPAAATTIPGTGPVRTATPSSRQSRRPPWRDRCQPSQSHRERLSAVFRRPIAGRDPTASHAAAAAKAPPPQRFRGEYAMSR